MKGGVVETPTSGNINKHLNIETGMRLFVELDIVIARDGRIDSGWARIRARKNNETGLRSIREPVADWQTRLHSELRVIHFLGDRLTCRRGNGGNESGTMFQNSFEIYCARGLCNRVCVHR